MRTARRVTIPRARVPAMTKAVRKRITARYKAADAKRRTKAAKNRRRALGS